MKQYDFDLIIIGGGSAGITGAAFASGLGKRAALYDSGRFGGECTWSGCVPSKALLQAAKLYHQAGAMERYGLPAIDLTKERADGALAGVRDIIQNIYSGETPEKLREWGITAEEGVSIEFVSPHTVAVNGERVTAKRFLIATGSSPLVPPIEGLSGTDFLTNENIFQLEKIPESLIVMGGGPIGVELSQAFNRLGSKVTLIEMAPRILAREDEEAARVVAKVLREEGITIVTGTRVINVQKEKYFSLAALSGDEEVTFQGEKLLVAAGRRPNTEGLALEKAGVAYDRRGILTDRRLRTTAGNIYAAGDVVGPYQFSHIANYQAIVAGTNALLPLRKSASYGNVPWITFSDPELARSGLTEAEAREKYKKIQVYRSGYDSIDRARSDRHETGFAKVICRPNGKILGIHVVGERAGEIMHELHLAKGLSIPLHKLNSVIHAYPAYSDIVKNVAKEAYISKIQNSLPVRIIKKLRGTQ